MKKDYVVIGKLSEVSIEDLIVGYGKEVRVDKKKLKRFLGSVLAVVVMSIITQDVVAAQEAFSINGETIEVAAVTQYKAPSQLSHLLQFIEWLIELLRLIVSSVAGLICTYAGYKWATAIESNGQETAKKILKNAFIGGLMVWTGTSIADFFVSKMNQLLL